MTETPRGPEPEAEYYQSIEEFFVARRGDPLFLSNPDWLLIRSWRRSGIPLRVVLRGITDALDGHAHSWGRHQKVASLNYCAPEVERAFERWHQSLASGIPEGGGEVAAFVDQLATALAGVASRVGDASIPKLIEALHERVRLGVEAPVLEQFLATQEKKLVRLLSKCLGKAIVAALEAEVDGQLRPYVERMPARVLAQVRHDALARRILESYGLGRLSLFLARG